MSDKNKSLLGILSNAVLAMYPILVLCFLLILKIPVRIFSLFTIALALFDIVFRILQKHTKKHISNYSNSLLLLIMGILGLIINTNIVHKLSPVMMNIMLLYTFGITLFEPPAMIYRFAVLADKSIPKSLGQKEIAAYCYKVTVIWVVFFIINGSIAALTVFIGSDLLWAIYNNGVSPVLIGSLFAGEFIVRKIVHKKIPKAIPLSSFNKKSRSLSHVVCYEGSWNDGIYNTWGDFLKDTSALRKKIEPVEGNRWFLHCDDCWHFLLAFTALLQCKKEIIISCNTSPACIRETKGDANFLTDHIFPTDGVYEKTFYIPSILAENVNKGINKFPEIISDKTSIVLFTAGGEPCKQTEGLHSSPEDAGSSKTPKAIKQQLTKLENDNAHILSMWGKELLNHKFCSTIDHHNINGFLFSILLPFTAGIPFRRQRIKAPEEFLKLNDTGYTIITSAAFLERGVEILKQNVISAKPAWVFLPDGKLDPEGNLGPDEPLERFPELARKTSEIFSFWPIEINLTTHGRSGWRQSNKGNEWTPFDKSLFYQNDLIQNS